MSTQIPGLVIERHALSKTEAHECRLPGFWARRRHGLVTGAVVRCLTCDLRYQWKYVGNYGGGGMTWARLP